MIMSDYDGPEIDAWQLLNNGYTTELHRLLDTMGRKELKALESDIREFQREVALAQIRKGA